jgi:hypothetical protein
VGALAVAEFEQIDDEIVGGSHGVGMFLAENLLTTPQRVLIHAAGLLVLALKAENVRQVVRRRQRVRVAVTEHVAAAGERVLGQATRADVGSDCS